MAPALDRWWGVRSGVRAVAPAWSPADLTDLAGWWKADAGAPTVDSDPVSSWQDQSGNGYHLTQATGSKQPIIKLNIINGLPVIRLDGVDDELVTALDVIAAGNQPHSLIVIGAYRTGAADGSRIASLGTNSTGEESCIGRLAPGPKAFYDGWGGGSQGSGTVAADTFYHFTKTYSSGEINGWLNGTADKVAQAFTYNFSATQRKLNVGSVNGFSAFAAVDVAEVILTHAALTAGERTSLWDYIATRFAL